MTCKYQIKIQNICIAIVFLAGLSVTIGAFFLPNYILPYDQLFPLPIVFSSGQSRYLKESPSQFILISNKGQEKKFQFNRDFYKTLDGPHRRKVRLYINLSRTNYAFNHEEKILTHYLCSNKVAQTFFNEDVVSKIKILDHKEQKSTYLNCSSQ